MVMLTHTGNGDWSIPEGDCLKGNNPSEGNKSNDTATIFMWLIWQLCY